MIEKEKKKKQNAGYVDVIYCLQQLVFNVSRCNSQANYIGHCCISILHENTKWHSMNLNMEHLLALF